MNSILFVLTILFVFSFDVYSEDANVVMADLAGKPVILYIGLTDRKMNETHHDYFVKVAQEQNPNSIVHSIILPRDISSKEDEEIAEYFRYQVSFLKLEDHSIELLVIATHGTTSENSRSETETTLQGLGKFSESKVSVFFDYNFSPLRTKMKTNAKIVLNSCSTFCGTEIQIANRASTLLNYFGITNGSIYGSKNLEIGVNGKNSKLIDKNGRAPYF